jgi:DNA-binding transcriptional LysR family regulator
MDAGDLAVFAAAAKAGRITKAAETLHTVQSNVTQRIRRLELELGVPLFNRHSRGVTLTSAGVQLLPYAERINRLLSEAKQAAADGPYGARPHHNRCTRVCDRRAPPARTRSLRCRLSGGRY